MSKSKEKTKNSIAAQIPQDFCGSQFNNSHEVQERKWRFLNGCHFRQVDLQRKPPYPFTVKRTLHPASV
jgi:hypothetical protein